MKVYIELLNLKIFQSRKLVRIETNIFDLVLVVYLLYEIICK